MSRPAQLEQQIERVKELQAEMLEGDKPVDPNATVDPVTPPVELPTDPVTPVVVESPVTISKEEYNRLEQRHRTLQGMYNADTARLRGELTNVTTALQNVEDRLIAAEKVTKAPSAPVKYITEKDEEEYGDTLDMVRRAAREEAEAITTAREQKYLERIAQLEQQTGHINNTVVPTIEGITKAQREQVKNDFWAALRQQIPDLDAINDSAEFKAWLLAEDPTTGGNKQYFLDQAAKQYDVPRVIKFFEEWKRTQAGGPTPAPKNNAQAELEKLVAPGASKAGNQAAPAKKQWTGSEIGKFYADIRNGLYADKLEERKKLENDLFLAQKEGRVS